MPFKEFDKRAASTSKDPFVTIQRRGPFGLNKAAYELMGSPEAVTLLYDEEEELIGFKPASTTNPRAFPVRVQGSNSSSYLIAGQKFTKFHGINTDTARRYGVELRDGILVVDLRAPSTDATGARLKARERESA